MTWTTAEIEDIAIRRPLLAIALLQLLMCGTGCNCLITPLFATIFGTVRGIAHDPDHRPVPDATVSLRAVSSEYSQTGKTDADGEFQLSAVPIGEYRVSVTREGFALAEQEVLVTSASAPVLHFQFRLATARGSVDVAERPDAVSPEAFTPTTVISRNDVDRTPGADQTNSLRMITSFVPGAYLTHDLLHIRGGHQVSWLIDGVPVPNTSIASNVGVQFDPKDIDYLEVQRGSYSAEYGDRTMPPSSQSDRRQRCGHPGIGMAG